jgi:Protein of unknown function (DUF4199)
MHPDSRPPGWGVLLLVGVLAGLVQAAAGVAMYVAGVYFAPWSMGVSIGVLLVCVLAGTSWYTTRGRGGEITYRQAFFVGLAISVCTGVVYAAYNLITIAYFYPSFLDEVVRTRLAHAGAGQPTAESVAAMRAQTSAWGIAIPNLVRLSIGGAVLSLVTSLFLKRSR